MKNKSSIEDIKNMSFVEYFNLTEAGIVTPPSGQTIAPTTQPTSQPSNSQPAAKSPQTINSWAGKGTPLQQGMVVGLAGPNGVPMPGEVSQVDISANGAKIKNPSTGKDQWMDIDSLQPFAAGATPGQNQPEQTVSEDEELQRLKELAGIQETCSAGATGAGGIAVAPTALGKMKKREPTEEGILKKEYTPTVAKTVAGDTKPNQATGALSANLAATGLKTANRRNVKRK
jgi:hypothetical protein